MSDTLKESAVDIIATLQARVLEQDATIAGLRGRLEAAEKLAVKAWTDAIDIVWSTPSVETDRDRQTGRDNCRGAIHSVMAMKKKQAIDAAIASQPERKPEIPRFVPGLGKCGKPCEIDTIGNRGCNYPQCMPAHQPSDPVIGPNGSLTFASTADMKAYLYPDGKLREEP